MKIGSSTVLFPTGKSSEPRVGPKDTEGKIISAKNDQVSLSDLSRKLSAMQTQVGDGGVDTKRVADIKTAIRNGEFRVNADVVADRLVQSVQDLLAKKN